MTGTPPKDTEETYSEAETVARREAALKNMLSTPHKAHKDSKKGNRPPKNEGEPKPAPKG